MDYSPTPTTTPSTNVPHTCCHLFFFPSFYTDLPDPNLNKTTVPSPTNGKTNSKTIHHLLSSSKYLFHFNDTYCYAVLL